ncbi:MAG: GerMN domain-containing protein [Microthrixaceae bacterium]|nr:GerMN domain-containing protein [Microthrixaceae bacterium]MCO5318039.1 GerMN domain-containing protein [Microthrixaceae bacterium]
MRSARRLRLRTAAVACLVALAAAACGIGADEEPRALPVTTTTTTVPTTEPTGDEEARLYMVKASALVPIIRRLPARTPRDVLNSLLVPPSGGEGQGLSSSIPSATRLLDITGPDDGLVEIDLSEDFEDVQGEARVLALGQIVMSETLLPGVERLSFAVEGEPLSIFSPERGDVDVVDACDYASSLTDPSAEDVDLTIQQALSLTKRREALREEC